MRANKKLKLPRVQGKNKTKHRKDYAEKQTTRTKAITIKTKLKTHQGAKKSAYNTRPASKDGTSPPFVASSGKPHLDHNRDIPENVVHRWSDLVKKDLISMLPYTPCGCHENNVNDVFERKNINRMDDPIVVQTRQVKAHEVNMCSTVFPHDPYTKSSPHSGGECFS